MAVIAQSADVATGTGSLATKLYQILSDDPQIALVAIAFAVLIVATATLIHKANLAGKVIVSAFLGLCLFILAMGTFIIFSPPSTPLHNATLQVRLDNKQLSLQQKTKGESKVTSDSGKLYVHRFQNEANTGSWKDEMLLKGKPDSIFVNIYNRRQIECRNPSSGDGAVPFADEFEEESVPVGPTRPQLSNTVFEINLKNAYDEESFLLELEYNDNIAYEESDVRLRADKLMFLRWDGLDKSKIRVIPQHAESLPCIRSADAYHEFSETITAQTDDNGGFWGLISRAWAGSDRKEQKEFIRAFTRAPDQRSQSRVTSYLEENTSEIAPLAADILGDDEVSEREKVRFLESLLQLPVSQRPRTRAFLDVLIPLVADDSYNIRRNAARLLRAPDFVNEDVAAAFKDYFEANNKKLAERQIANRSYSARYLVVAAGRDLFYNKGIGETDRLRDTFTSLSEAERKALLATAIQSFQDGQTYAAFAPDDRRVLFAKLQYGISYAYFRTAVAERVVADGGASTPDQLANEIFKQVKSGTVIPETAPHVKDARSAFEAFVADLGDNAARYSWQHHITQAKQCLSSDSGLAFDCMQLNRSS